MQGKLEFFFYSLALLQSNVLKYLGFWSRKPISIKKYLEEISICKENFLSWLVVLGRTRDWCSAHTFQLIMFFSKVQTLSFCLDLNESIWLSLPDFKKPLIFCEILLNVASTQKRNNGSLFMVELSIGLRPSRADKLRLYFAYSKRMKRKNKV